MSVSVRRKILAAILSSLLFAVIFSVPGGFEMNSFANLYYLNLMFVVSYGVITSLISDWVSKKTFQSTYSREICSFLLHCLFGSVFLILSLASAISFFIIDRLLTKVKVKWWTVCLALFLVIFLFFKAINRGN
ncbi:hypothetical protein [Neobacillus dielmonensis]|uniref:hypothetical protein n=1 Tax=Neobacillus dielmonensis TaxID=1347369 RepID=UPI000B0DF8BB|nr:hypothetical protein [Neobacillus dielmonensis]